MKNHLKKYRLIREYPGSPELGTIAEKAGDIKYTYPNGAERSVSSAAECLFETLIENQPKFWEEVVEKEYEILSFKGRKGTTIENDIFTNKNEFHLYFDKWHLENVQIHSVKRLSDGEVFTVGDKVDSTISDLGRFTDLTGFKLDNNKILFGLRYLGYYPLSTIIKYKKPLFTTEDGVDIFEGEKYQKLFIIPKNTFTIKECNKHITREPFPFSNNAKYFSTKESAEEYVLMNKSKYSINDILASLPNRKCEKYISIKQMIENLKNM